MPQPNPRPCARCALWRPADRERAYQAPCALHNHRPAFDATCASWQGLPQPPAPVTWAQQRGPLGKKVT